MDTNRIDGRELPEPTEEGSDALLLLGLLAILRSREGHGQAGEDDAEPAG